MEPKLFTYAKRLCIYAFAFSCLTEVSAQSIPDQKGNTKLYAIMPEFKDYNVPLQVRVVADKNYVNSGEVGFVISSKPIKEFGGEQLNNRKPYNYEKSDDFLGDLIAERVSDFDASMINDTYYYASNKIDRNEGRAVVELGIPKYCATYYIRPYAKLTDGSVLLGEEKQFVTKNTKLGFLSTNDCLASYNNMVINKSAIKFFCSEHDILGKVSDNDYNMKVLADHVVNFVRNNKNKYNNDLFANRVVKTEKCVDASLGIIDQLPGRVAGEFWNSLQDTIDIDLREDVNDSINFACNGVFTEFVKDIKTVKCDKGMNVPGNTYYRFEPSLMEKNPFFGFNIKKYLMPAEYDIYAVFVNPEGSLPNVFRVDVIEEDSNGKMPGQGKYLTNGGKIKNYVTNKDAVCETIHLGKHTFSGTNSILQFRCNVANAESEAYSREMRLARVYLVASK